MQSSSSTDAGVEKPTHDKVDKKKDIAAAPQEAAVGTVTVTVRLLSGNEVFGPKAVPRSLTVGDLKCLFEPKQKKKLVLNERVLGDNAETLESWPDPVELNANLEERSPNDIVEIRARIGWYVDAIILIFADGRTPLEYGGSGGKETEVAKLSPEEHVVKVTQYDCKHADEYLAVKFVFVTSEGRELPIKGSRKDVYGERSHTVEEGERLIGFELKGNKLEGLKTALPDAPPPMQAQAASENAQPPGAPQLEEAEATAEATPTDELQLAERPPTRLLVVKGNLRHRIEKLGVEKETDMLTTDQRDLRDIAADQWGKPRPQMEHPERPDWANGAFVYLTEADARDIKKAVREAGIQLQSKHVLVSAEHLPLVKNVLSSGPSGSGREAFLLRRAGAVESNEPVPWPASLRRLPGDGAQVARGSQPGASGDISGDGPDDDRVDGEGDEMLPGHADYGPHRKHVRLLQLDGHLMESKDVDLELAEYLTAPASVQELDPDMWTTAWKQVCKENDWIEMRRHEKCGECPYCTLCSKWAEVGHLMGKSCRGRQFRNGKQAGNLLRAILNAENERRSAIAAGSATSAPSEAGSSSTAAPSQSHQFSTAASTLSSAPSAGEPHVWAASAPFTTQNTPEVTIDRQERQLRVPPPPPPPPPPRREPANATTNAGYARGGGYPASQWSQSWRGWDDGYSRGGWRSW